jgi:hypothetical protein
MFRHTLPWYWALTTSCHDCLSGYENTNGTWHQAHTERLLFHYKTVLYTILHEYDETFHISSYIYFYTSVTVWINQTN